MRGDTMSEPDRGKDDRRVSTEDPVLPDQTADDTDAGWGAGSDDDDRRLQQDRPPHWDQ